MHTDVIYLFIGSTPKITYDSPVVILVSLAVAIMPGSVLDCPWGTEASYPEAVGTCAWESDGLCLVQYQGHWVVVTWGTA